MSRPHHPVLIRAAELADAAGLAALFHAPEAARGTLQHPYMTEAASRAHLEAMPKGDLQLVAVLDGQVVGTATLGRAGNPRRSHSALLGLIVRHDHQRQGIGTALLEAVLDMADRWMGLVRIELSVWHDNTHAIRLYERFGFEREGRFRWNGLRDGVLTDSIPMARLRRQGTIPPS